MEDCLVATTAQQKISRPTGRPMSDPQLLSGLCFREDSGSGEQTTMINRHTSYIRKMAARMHYSYASPSFDPSILLFLVSHFRGSILGSGRTFYFFSFLSTFLSFPAGSVGRFLS